MNDGLELAVRGSNIGIWDIDMPDGDFRHGPRNYVNIWERLGYERLDFPPDHETGMAPIHPDDRALVEEAARKYLAGETSKYEIECRVRHKDSSYRWMLARGVAVRDAGGKPIRFVGSAIDITDLKRAEEALRESEERFRGTFENAAVGIAHTHPTGRLLRVNEKFCAIVGYPRAELLRKTFQDITHPDDLAASVASLAALLRGESPALDHEKRYRRRDGSPVWVELFTSLQRDATGKPAYAIAVIQDISERRKLEEALRQAHRDLERKVEERTAALGKQANLLNLTHDAILVRDRDSAVKYWNRGAEELYGWTAEEATGKASHQLLRTVFPAPIEQIERELVSAGRWVGELVHTKKDGSQVVVASRWSLQRDEHGTPVAILEINNDITERKRAEEALRESEAKLEGAQRIAHVGYWDRDLETDLVTWSDETYRIYGVPPEERVLTLDRIRERIHPDDRQRMVELAAEAIQGRGRYDVEYRVVRPNGEVRIIHSRGDVTRDKEDRPRRMFGTVQDITERRAREAAEAANRAKDEFLANVSHEIRTPMNAILGMTELTLDTQLTEDQRQCLRTVKSAADNLLGIINDLLDFSKIEAGKLELDLADFSLRGAVGDTLRALALRAHKKGLELIYQVQPYVPDALVGDAGRLRQVLLNLVGNALKFTEQGEVVVQVSLASPVALAPGDALPALTQPGSLEIRFTVRDTGIGIPPDKQASIFRAFEQEDSSTTRKYGGTGLGLTIASRLVALMGGTITVDSAPGRGSIFAFTARFGRRPHQTESAAPRPPVLAHNPRVLIVDDNATNRHILEEWLRGWQMEPAAVGDGVAALGALWDAVSAGRPYALVLLDARMPDTDGLALAAKIRKRAELSATGIILLTSGDRPGDLARSREQGVDAHLLKPVQQDELLETIYRVLRKDEGGRMKDEKELVQVADSSFSLQPSSFPLRVLVAEDNEFNAQLLEQLLGRRGHRVRLATNGREALSLAGEEAFDLLLLDVHMPELDGFQVVQAIRERERTTGGHLPVVALTARSRKEDRLRCLAAGMDDFLAKPIQAADLWGAMDRALRKDEGGRMKDENEKKPASDSSFILHPSSFREGLLDPRVLLAACGGDAAILEKISETFRARLPDDRKAVQNALRDRDAPRLREAAHKFAGMVAAFSSVAGGVASELEDRAAQGQLDEARPLAERLEAMVEELMRLVGGLSLDALRDQAGAAAEPGRTDGP